MDLFVRLLTGPEENIVAGGTIRLGLLIENAVIKAICPAEQKCDIILECACNLFTAMLFIVDSYLQEIIGESQNEDFFEVVECERNELEVRVLEPAAQYSTRKGKFKIGPVSKNEYFAFALAYGDNISYSQPFTVFSKKKNEAHNNLLNHGTDFQKVSNTAVSWDGQCGRCLSKMERREQFTRYCSIVNGLGRPMGREDTEFFWELFSKDALEVAKNRISCLAIAGNGFEDWVNSFRAAIQNVVGECWKFKFGPFYGNCGDEVDIDSDDTPVWFIQGFITPEQATSELMGRHVPCGSFIIRFSCCEKKEPKFVISLKISATQVTHRFLTTENGKVKLEGDDPIYAQDLREMILDCPNFHNLYYQGACIPKSVFFGITPP